MGVIFTLGNEMNSILNPSFRYKNSYSTNISKTFEKARKQIAEEEKRKQAAEAERKEKVRSIGK